MTQAGSGAQNVENLLKFVLNFRFCAWKIFPPNMELPKSDEVENLNGNIDVIVQTDDRLKGLEPVEVKPDPENAHGVKPDPEDAHGVKPQIQETPKVDPEFVLTTKNLERVREELRQEEILQGKKSPLKNITAEPVKNEPVRI